MSSETFQQEAASPSFGELWSKAVQSFSRADSEYLARKRDYSVETVEWLRAFGLIGRYENGVAFPIRDKSGSICGLHCRLADGWSWKVLGGPMHPLVIGNPHAASTVYAFASPWDAFAIADKLGLFQPWGVSIPLIITRGYDNGRLVADLCDPDTTLYAFATNRRRTLRGFSTADRWPRDVRAHAGCRVLRVPLHVAWEDFNGWTDSGRATAEELREAISSAKQVNKRNKRN